MLRLLAGYRTKAWLTATTSLLLGSFGAHADVAPGLRIWTWDPPAGQALRDHRYVGIVRVKAQRDAAATADRVCDEIRSRRLRTGNVCILLQNFGMPTRLDPSLQAPMLFGHPADHVAGTDRPTPWVRHGLRECRSWMNDFIARYRANQRAAPGIPDPTRFHFDVEGEANPRTRGSVVLFTDMMRDARWTTERLPGFGQTLAELLAEADVAPPEPDEPFWSRNNRAWVAWYSGICLESADAALDAAAYEPIRAAWPECKSSNYGTSERYDGLLQRFKRCKKRPAIAFTAEGSGDLMAPVLYLSDPRSQEQGESLLQTTLRESTIKLDANILSHGGPHRDVVPWILIAHHTRDRNGTRTSTNEAFTRDVHALLRSRGIHEILLYSEKPPSAHWNADVRALHDAWSVDVTDLRVHRGTAAGSPDDAHMLRHGDDLRIEPVDDVVVLVADVHTTWTRTNADQRLRVVIEGTPLVTAPARIAIATNAPGGAMASVEVAAGEDRVEIDLPATPDLLVTNPLQLVVHCRFNRPGVMGLDLIQAHRAGAGDPPSRADELVTVSPSPGLLP